MTREVSNTTRATSSPTTIDESIEVTLCECPHCGSKRFRDQSRIEQLIEDIPPVRPRVTRLTTYETTCMQCGQTLRSGHPLQMSLAAGVALCLLVEVPVECDIAVGGPGLVRCGAG